MKVTLAALRSVEHMRPPGYLDEVLSRGVVEVDPEVGEFVDIPHEEYRSLVAKFSPGSPLPVCGPGCQLKRTFGVFGINSEPGCGCDEFAARMDAWGPAECWTRLEEIVDHLAEQAAKRGLPFVATAARIAVARAIQAAEKEVSNAAPQAAEADPRRPG